MKKISLLLILILFGALAASAEEIPKQEILELNDTIQEKRTRLEELKDQIDTYRKLIAKKQTEAISLANQIGLLDNHIAKTQLDIEATTVEIEGVALEIQLIEREIDEKEIQIARKRLLLKDLLREIQQYDERSNLELIVGAETFSEFYAHLHFLEDMQSQLQETVDGVRLLKAAQEAQREERGRRLASLEELRKTLERKKFQLEEEQGSKEYLLTAAQSSEQRFQELLQQLRAESQFVDVQLGALSQRLTDRLRELDVDFGGGTIFSWPLVNHDRITTYFHDPDYPFRYLFEHSGLDVATPVGTPILSSAPGIVAIARTGRQYGNYVVVVHANGMSTLYAHMSRILVDLDEFVDRGDTIGLSGGARGAPGSGLSTGPHLHFEIRVDGVPTNPLEYLVNL